MKKLILGLALLSTFTCLAAPEYIEDIDGNLYRIVNTESIQGMVNITQGESSPLFPEHSDLEFGIHPQDKSDQIFSPQKNPIHYYSEQDPRHPRLQE